MTKDFKPKQRDKISPLQKTIFTHGEFFSDGSAIELARDPADSERLELLHWDGKKAIIRSRVERDDGVYVPAILDPSIIRALRFPTEVDLHGTAQQLLEDISRLFAQYSKLGEPFISIVGRSVLASWLFDAIAAPWLSIVGPETTGGTNSFKLCSVLFRHAVPLTDIALSQICSLPMELGLTLMVRSAELRPNIERVIAMTRKRDEFILRNGHLHNLHCSLVTYSQFPDGRSKQRICGLEVPIRSIQEQLPILDERTQQQIAASLQPRLLGYRFKYFMKARDSKFDISQFTYATRELAQSLGACTPGDELPEDLLQYLETYDAEFRSTRWVDQDVAIIESLACFCREGESRFKYIGDIAKEVFVILSRRGEERVVTPHEVGHRIRLMGFKTEPRDSNGFKVERTATFRRHVDHLAQELAVPFIQNEKVKTSSDNLSRMNNVEKRCKLP